MKFIEKVPYLLIIQFKEEAEKLGIRDISLRIERGGERGFDKKATLETPWLAEALKKVTKL